MREFSSKSSNIRNWLEKIYVPLTFSLFAPRYFLPLALYFSDIGKHLYPPLMPPLINRKQKKLEYQAYSCFVKALVQGNGIFWVARNVLFYPGLLSASKSSEAFYLLQHLSIARIERENFSCHCESVLSHFVIFLRYRDQVPTGLRVVFHTKSCGSIRKRTSKSLTANVSPHLLHGRFKLGW